MHILNFIRKIKTTFLLYYRYHLLLLLYNFSVNNSDISSNKKFSPIQRVYLQTNASNKQQVVLRRTIQRVCIYRKLCGENAESRLLSLRVMASSRAKSIWIYVFPVLCAEYCKYFEFRLSEEGKG